MSEENKSTEDLIEIAVNQNATEPVDETVPDGIAVPRKPPTVGVKRELGLASIGQARFLAKAYATKQCELLAGIVNTEFESRAEAYNRSVEALAKAMGDKYLVSVHATSEAFDALAREIEKFHALVEARTLRGRLKRFGRWLNAIVRTPPHAADDALAPLISYDEQLEALTVDAEFRAIAETAPDVAVEDGPDVPSEQADHLTPAIKPLRLVEHSQ